MTIIKSLLNIFMFVFLLGEFAMAKDFTQVNNVQYYVDRISSLQDLNPPRDNNWFTKKSPLNAILYANQKNNQIDFQLTLKNKLDQQWFYKYQQNEYFIFMNQEWSVINRYPPSSPQPGFENVDILSDQEYGLIEPYEELVFNFNIPANYFFNYFKNQIIYISYVDSNLPPSMVRSLNEVKNDELYTVLLLSNVVKIRCYDYNESQDKYYCDVETLSNLPVFK